MKVISREEIKKILSMKEAISLVKEGMRIYFKRDCVIPLRQRIDVEKQNSCILFMPAYSNKLGYAGLKVVSVFPDNVKFGKDPVPASVFLIDGESGEILAIMDGTIITKIRTGALQGASTDILSRKDSKRALIIGCGSQAPYQLEALLTVRKLDTVYVFDIIQDKIINFVNMMKDKYPELRIIPISEPDESVKDVDIIITVTTSHKPTFSGELIKKGTHICSIGSFTPDMQEIDEISVKKSGRIYVDTREGTMNEAGDVINPLKKGIISEKDVIELGEVIENQKKGRQGEEDITIFKSVGSAIFDLICAVKIYEKAKRANIGKDI